MEVAHMGSACLEEASREDMRAVVGLVEATMVVCVEVGHAAEAEEGEATEAERAMAREVVAQMVAVAASRGEAEGWVAGASTQQQALAAKEVAGAAAGMGAAQKD